MKKIYTITFQKALNYGATLQAYALVKFLKSLGHDVKIIDYLPHYFFLQTYRPAKGLRKTLDKYKKLKSFSVFSNKFLPLTDKTYFTKKSMRRITDAHAIVCGSDQIWNKSLTGGEFDGAYFIDFAPPGTRRIAFAASAGSIRIKDHPETVKEYIPKLDAVGVREEILEADIKEVLPDKQIKTVLDPSLLIRDYSEVIIPSCTPNKKYIVSYVVGSGEMLSRFDRAIKKLKATTDIPVIHIGAKPIPSADENILNIGPSEWLTYIKNSCFVITNSFHGTAFSLNFEKNFIFIPHSIDNLNHRQTTLLKKLDLMSAMRSREEEIDFSGEPVNYSIITPRLNKLMEESREFLISSIG